MGKILTPPRLVYTQRCILAHLLHGLRHDSANDLDIAAGGSFAHRSPTEGREILDRILRKSSLPSYPCEPQHESKLHHESLSSAACCTMNAFASCNLLKTHSSKTFRRMVVDAFVYLKHCKFCGCTIALTLQLKHN